MRTLILSTILGLSAVAALADTPDLGLHKLPAGTTIALKEDLFLEANDYWTKLGRVPVPSPRPDTTAKYYVDCYLLYKPDTARRKLTAGESFVVRRSLAYDAHEKYYQPFKLVRNNTNYLHDVYVEREDGLRAAISCGYGYVYYADGSFDLASYQKGLVKVEHLAAITELTLPVLD